MGFLSKLFGSDTEISPAERERRLSEEVVSANGINACVTLYRKLPLGSKHEQTLIGKIEKVAVGYGAWQTVARSVGHQSVLGIRARLRLTELARSFDELAEVVDLPGLDDAKRDEIIQKMADVAATTEECATVLKFSAPGTSRHEALMKKVEKVANTAEEWKEVYDSLNEDDPLREVVFQKRAELATSVEDLDSLFCDLPSDDPREVVVFQKLRTLSLSASEWSDARQDDNLSDAIRDIALEKEIELTEDLDDLVSLWEEISDDYEAGGETVLRKLTQRTLASAEWRRLAESCCSSDSMLATELWKKVVEDANGTHELVDLYRELVDDGDYEEALFEAIEEKLVKTATLSELKIVARLSPDDNLGSAAESEIERRESAST